MGKRNQFMDFQEWNKMKSLGKKKYVWINGVVKWGLFTGILMPIIWQFFDEGFHLYSIINPNFFRRLIITMILFPLGGYIHYHLLWKTFEKKYGK